MTKLGMKLIGGAAAALMMAPASAETLIVAHDLPPAHYFSVRVFESLMQCIKDGTGGAYDFDYFPGGSVLKRDQGITGIQDGLAHMTFVTIGEETARMPMQGVTMLPGFASGATDLAAAWRKALDKGGLLAGEWEAMGVIPLSVTALAPYQIVSNQSTLIDSPEDFAGKKIRSTGSALNFLVEGLGGVAVQMPGPEIYTAMQRGTVDATLFSFASVKPYSVQEVMSAMSRNGSFGTAAQAVGISAELYNSLPSEDQKVFHDCGRKIESDLVAWLDTNESAIADEFSAMGINIFDFTEEDLAKFDEGMAGVAEDFIGRLTARSIPADEALEELKAGFDG